MRRKLVQVGSHGRMPQKSSSWRSALRFTIPVPFHPQRFGFVDLQV